jgi:zinc/manganese transport system substrate-binding protein
MSPASGRRTAAALLATAFAAVTFAAGGCASGPASTATDGSTLIQVAAAQSVWGDIAQQLGGSQVEVTSITTGATTDQRDFQPSAAELQVISGAQLFIIDGAGYDPWADQAAAAHPGIQRLELDAGDEVGIAPGGNPYLWDDPQYVSTVAQQITADYIQLRPSYTSYFQSQEQMFEAGTLAADSALISGIKAEYAGTPVGASDPVAIPLAAALGLNLLTSAQYLDAGGAANGSQAAEQSAETQIRDHQIKVFVYDTEDHSPAVEAQLAAATAAQIPVAAVSETPEPAGDSFQQWQTEQLDSIKGALAEAAGPQ